MTSDLCGEERTAVDVCVEYMGKKNLGEVGNPVERISTLLDPRRKTLSKQKCVNGSPDVKQLAINELKDVADLFEGSAPQQQTTVPAASASAPAPAPASALAPPPAPPPAPAPALVATGPRGHWQRSRGCSPLWSSDAPTDWLPLGVRVPLEMRRRAARTKHHAQGPRSPRADEVCNRMGAAGRERIFLAGVLAAKGFP